MERMDKEQRERKTESEKRGKRAARKRGWKLFDPLEMGE